MPEFIAAHVPSDLDEFTTAYLECAEWTDMNSDNPLAERATGFDPRFVAESIKDCADFQEAQANKLIRYTEATGRGMSSAGHDFWLTRNGHGAGFWDRGEDPVLQELTDAAHAYGETYAEFTTQPDDLMMPAEFWETAAQWGSAMTGGDPGACMYGFDETGRVQSEDHRQACLDWIEQDCRKAADANEDPEGDHEQLDQLVGYLKQAPIAA